MNIILCNSVNKLINIFRKNNYNCYLVGGAVRDLLLNLEPEEYDFATDAPPNIIKKLFTKHIDVGEPYGCIKVYFENYWYEITTFRIEYGYEDFRHPKTIKFITSLQFDSFRRDFTINSIYTNGVTIIDHLNGINDLKNNLLRLIGNKNLKLQEDPIRILRLLKFKSKLNFKIEFLTLLALKNNIYLLKYLTKYRIHNELCKIFENEFYYETLNLFNKLNGFTILLNKPITFTNFKNIQNLTNKFHIKIFCMLYFNSNINNSLILTILKDKFNFSKESYKELEIIYKIIKNNDFENTNLYIKKLILLYDYNITYIILNILSTYIYSCKNLLKKFYKIKWSYEPVKYDHINIKLHKIIINKKSIIKYKKYLITLVHFYPYLNKEKILTKIVKSNSQFLG